MSETAKSASMTAVLELVRSNHDMAERGHKSLREDVRDLQTQVESLEAANTALEKRLVKAERPVDVERMTFSMRQTIAIVGAIAGGVLIVSGIMWQVKGSVSDLQTSIQTVTKTQDERNRLQDERTQTQKESMDQLRAALEMRRVEIQNLSNIVQQRLGALK